MSLLVVELEWYRSLRRLWYYSHPTHQSLLDTLEFQGGGRKCVGTNTGVRPRKDLVCDLNAAIPQVMAALDDGALVILADLRDGRDVASAILRDRRCVARPVLPRYGDVAAGLQCQLHVVFADLNRVRDVLTRRGKRGA